MNDTALNKRMIRRMRALEDRVGRMEAVLGTRVGARIVAEPRLLAPPAQPVRSQLPAVRGYKRRNVGLWKFEENRDIHAKVISMFLDGVGRREIADKLGWSPEDPYAGPSPEQIFAATYNGVMPSWYEPMRFVEKSGPTSWAEAWVIGSTLFTKRNKRDVIPGSGRSWIGPTVDFLVPADSEARQMKAMTYDINDHTTRKRVSEFRHRFADYLKWERAQRAG